MNLTQARATWIPRPKPVRVGRGDASGLGKTSGKGEKGAKARAGYSRRAYFVGGQMPIIRKIPKRGFSRPRGLDFAVVNCADLNRFADGETVDVARLQAVGLVQRLGDGVKLLGGGALKRKLTVKVDRASASAKAKVEKAGGTVQAAERVTSPRVRMPAPAPAAKSAPKGGGKPPAPPADAAAKPAAPPVPPSAPRPGPAGGVPKPEGKA